MLTDAAFVQIRDIVYRACRIDLREGKRELVEARLKKRLRQLGIDSYDDYLQFLEADASGAEMKHMLDVLTTNLTYFFRESDHFDYLAGHIRETSRNSSRIRVWSAGCSSGEEPYSMAMVLAETCNLSQLDCKILATDVSTRMIDTARSGTYPQSKVKHVPPALLEKYFERLDGDLCRVKPVLSNMVFFRHHNLAADWPMKGPFDAIFCRNVMIYFDRYTQQEIVARFSRLLSPGGVLIVGHSESLAGIRHTLSYVQPSIYANST